MSDKDSSTAGMISREPSHSSFAMADENDEHSQSNTAMFTQVSACAATEPTSWHAPCQLPLPLV